MCLILSFEMVKFMEAVSTSRKFRVLGFEFKVSGIEFGVSVVGFRVWVWVFGFRFLGLGVRVSGFGFGALCLVSDVCYLVFGA